MRMCNAICKKEEERKRLGKASRGLPGHVELLLFFSKKEEETAEGVLRESDRPFVTGPSSWSQARSRCCTLATVATPCTCRVRSNSIASSDFCRRLPCRGEPTLEPIARPSSSACPGLNIQKEVYTGHKKKHGVKYQAVTTPDGPRPARSPEDARSACASAPRRGGTARARHCKKVDATGRAHTPIRPNAGAGAGMRDRRRAVTPVSPKQGRASQAASRPTGRCAPSASSLRS